jgi:hypothetical protein
VTTSDLNQKIFPCLSTNHLRRRRGAISVAIGGLTGGRWA